MHNSNNTFQTTKIDAGGDRKRKIYWTGLSGRIDGETNKILILEFPHQLVRGGHLNH